jgi:hypothetical protein
MGQDTPDVNRRNLDHFLRQVHCLLIRQRLYEKLYRSGPERRVLLERSSKTFFDIVQQDIRNEMALSIRRMCDPHKKRGNKNLSMARVEGHGQLLDGKKKDLRSIRERLKSVSKVLTEHADQRLAHQALPRATGGKTGPWDPEGDWATMQEAVHLVVKFRQTLLDGLGMDLPADHDVAVADDVDDLIELLERAADKL